jgi:hypothetical protein
MGGTYQQDFGLDAILPPYVGRDHLDELTGSGGKVDPCTNSRAAPLLR